MESVRKEFGALFSDSNTLLGEEIIFTSKSKDDWVGKKAEIIGVDVGAGQLAVVFTEGEWAGFPVSIGFSYDGKSHFKIKKFMEKDS